jgi:hypothetical protein
MNGVHLNGVLPVPGPMTPELATEPPCLNPALLLQQQGGSIPCGHARTVAQVRRILVGAVGKVLGINLLDAARARGIPGPTRNSSAGPPAPEVTLPGLTNETRFGRNRWYGAVTC